MSLIYMILALCTMIFVEKSFWDCHPDELSWWTWFSIQSLICMSMFVSVIPPISIVSHALITQLLGSLTIALKRYEALWNDKVFWVAGTLLKISPSAIFTVQIQMLPNEKSSTLNSRSYSSGRKAGVSSL